MRFLKYISEFKDGEDHVSRFETISKEEFKQLIAKPEYANTLNQMKESGVWIYRGHRFVPGPYVKFSTSATQRPSNNTHNYYTMIMNNAPQWKEWPQRAYICSTNVVRAG